VHDIDHVIGGNTVSDDGLAVLKASPVSKKQNILFVPEFYLGIVPEPWSDNIKAFELVFQKLSRPIRLPSLIPVAGTQLIGYCAREQYEIGTGADILHKRGTSFDGKMLGDFDGDRKIKTALQRDSLLELEGSEWSCRVDE
jgi:hypothetical protein